MLHEFGGILTVFINEIVYTINASLPQSYTIYIPNIKRSLWRKWCNKWSFADRPTFTFTKVSAVDLRTSDISMHITRTSTKTLQGSSVTNQFFWSYVLLVTLCSLPTKTETKLNLKIKKLQSYNFNMFG